MRLRLYLHVALWSALIAGFIAFTIPSVVPAILGNKLGPIEANYSTDSYLSGLTHIRNGTQLFADLVDSLPRDRTAVIFVRDQNWESEFLGMLVAYLSWPLEARIVKVRPETIEQNLSAAKSDAVAGFFFCSIKPPRSISGGTNFGSEIVFVPSSAGHTE